MQAELLYSSNPEDFPNFVYPFVRVYHRKFRFTSKNQIVPKESDNNGKYDVVLDSLNMMSIRSRLDENLKHLMTMEQVIDRTTKTFISTVREVIEKVSASERQHSRIQCYVQNENIHIPVEFSNELLLPPNALCLALINSFTKNGGVDIASGGQFQISVTNYQCAMDGHDVYLGFSADLRFDMSKNIDVLNALEKIGKEVGSMLTQRWNHNNTSPEQTHKFDINIGCDFVSLFPRVSELNVKDGCYIKAIQRGIIKSFG